MAPNQTTKALELARDALQVVQADFKKMPLATGDEHEHDLFLRGSVRTALAHIEKALTTRESPPDVADALADADWYRNHLVMVLNWANLGPTSRNIVKKALAGRPKPTAQADQSTAQAEKPEVEVVNPIEWLYD